MRNADWVINNILWCVIEELDCVKLPTHRAIYIYIQLEIGPGKCFLMRDVSYLPHSHMPFIVWSDIPNEKCWGCVCFGCAQLIAKARSSAELVIWNVGNSQDHPQVMTPLSELLPSYTSNWSRELDRNSSAAGSPHWWTPTPKLPIKHAIILRSK